MDLRDACVGNPCFQGLTRSQAHWQEILYFRFVLGYLADLLWSMMGKLGKKNNARRLRKQYISPMGTLPQQILTLCNVTCKYTMISCLVLYKFQEIVSRWGIGRSCMALVFRTFLNFLKKRQDRHHLVMFIWSCWKWCHYYQRGKPHKGQQRAEPRASIWEAMTCTKVWTVTLGNTNANSMTREVFLNVPCHWRYGDARIFVLQIWQENWPL